MTAEIVYLKDFETLEAESKRVDATSQMYKTSDYAYWKVLIAAEDVRVEKNRIAIVKIKEVRLPSNTIVSPLSIMRHGLGVVLDVYEQTPSRVEDEKKLVAVAFLPVDNGLIKKGDLIGVVKVFVVGLYSGKFEIPSVSVELEHRTVNLVYRTNGEIVREEVDISECWYKRWHIAEWFPLIADEDVELKPSELAVVKIKPLEIPPETIPVPLSIMRHAYGTVLDVVQLGKPRRIEDSKTISRVIFMPIFKGEIEEGDVIGILNVYYISVGERIRSLMRHLTKPLKGKLVYRKRAKIVRNQISIEPFSFKRSAIGRFEPLIASEDKEIKAGSVEIIRIQEIELPSGTIVQPLTSKNNANGLVIDVVSEGRPRLVEEDKEIQAVAFLPIRDGFVRKGEVLGILNVYYVSVLREPEFFLARYRSMFQKV